MKKVLFLLIIIINVVLTGAQLALTSRRSSDGELIAGYSREFQAIDQENSQLEEQIYQLSSLSQLSLRAQELQLVPIANTYLSVPPVAVAAKTP